MKRIALPPVVALALALALIGCERRLEVIRLVPVDKVSLVAPDSLAGASPRHLGVLAPGQALYVTGCNPRKSDIDVQVSWAGAPAVALGTYRLERRPAQSDEEHAIGSCAGLLGGGS